MSAGTYRAVTCDIGVTVAPGFDVERSDPARAQFFWIYRIEIVNHGVRTAQLMHRYWRITDANGGQEEVRGPGVVGEQPILKPGESYSYASGCPLRTPSGIMEGSYRMVDENGRAFDVAIPAFSLDSPFARRVIN